MRGRKPIGQAAMTNAERQRRWRQRHHGAKTPSEKFRRKLYWLIRWFSDWLSADEIKETFKAFGMAWAMDNYLVKEKGEPPEWMDRVYWGEDVMGNPGDRLGDEERYQREREERQQAEERFRPQWEDLLIAHNGDARRAAGEMIARLAA
jgi:hypothetical protein